MPALAPGPHRRGRRHDRRHRAPAAGGRRGQGVPRARRPRGDARPAGGAAGRDPLRPHLRGRGAASEGARHGARPAGPRRQGRRPSGGDGGAGPGRARGRLHRGRRQRPAGVARGGLVRGSRRRPPRGARRGLHGHGRRWGRRLPPGVPGGDPSRPRGLGLAGRSAVTDTALLAVLLAAIAGLLAGRAWAAARRRGDSRDRPPYRVSPHYTQGLHYVAAGQRELAISELTKVAREDPEALQAGRIDAAEKAFRTALSLDRRVFPAHLGLADCQAGRDPRQAAAVLEDAVQTSPERAYLAFDRLALAYADSGEPSRFVGLCEQTIRQDPRDWRARLALARHLGREGRHEEAFGLLLRAVEANPQVLLPHLEMWRTLRAMGLEGEVVDRYIATAEESAFYRDPHVCTACRYRADDMLWRCPHCHEWNTFVEERLGPTAGAKS